MMPWFIANRKTCAQIERDAFAIHPKCYTGPVRHSPSIRNPLWHRVSLPPCSDCGFCTMILEPGNWDGLLKVYDFKDMLTLKALRQVPLYLYSARFQ